MMKAITTKYHGPTNVRGSRIIAREPDGASVVRPYDHALNSDQNHQRAAEALADQLGWTGRLVQGALKDGYVHVFVED